MIGPETMRTIDEDTPARAARVLEGGGLVVMPTDTVYGLAAALDEPCALDRVFYAKRRPRDMPLPVLVASPRAAGRLAAEPLSGPALTLCERFWPGALTIIVRAAGSVPSQVTAGGETVGLRMPAGDVALEIIAGVGGALAVTSANLSGEPPPREAADVPQELLAHVALVVDGGPCPGGVPSTVVDVSGPEPRVLREGAIPADAILDALGGERS